MASKSKKKSSSHTQQSISSVKKFDNKISETEAEAAKIVDEFITMGVLSRDRLQKTSNRDLHSSDYDLISPFKIRSADPEILRKHYETLVKKVVELDSELHSMKLQICSYQTQQEFSDRRQTEYSTYVDQLQQHYKTEFTNLQRKLDSAVKRCKELNSEMGKMKMENDSLKSNEHKIAESEIANFSDSEALRSSHDKLLRQSEELEDQLNRETQLRASLEESQSALMERIEELEGELVTERDMVASLGARKQQLEWQTSQAREEFNVEHKCRVEAENTLKYLQQNSEANDVKTRSLEDERNLLVTELTKLKESYRELNCELEKLESQRIAFDETDRIIELRERLRQDEKQRSSMENKLKELEYERRVLKEDLINQEVQWKAESRAQEHKLRDMKVNLVNLEDDKKKLEQEKETLLKQVGGCVDEMKTERARLDAELTALRVELAAFTKVRTHLEADNANLREKIGRAEEQRDHHAHLGGTLTELLEAKRTLAYEKGQLQDLYEEKKKEADEGAEAKRQLAQVKTAFGQIETKYTKTQMDVSQCRYHIQSLEAQMRQREEAAQRRERELEVTVQSRDEAVKEAQRLLGHVETVEDREKKRVCDLQSSLDAARTENRKMRETLESVMQAHTELQNGLELLQTEVGQKDTSLSRLRREREEDVQRRQRAQDEITSLTAKVSTLELAHESELTPLRQTESALRTTHARMTSDLEDVSRERDELRLTMSGLEEELSRARRTVEEVGRARQLSDQERRSEQRQAEDRIRELRGQLGKEREKNLRRGEKEGMESRRQLDEMLRENSELTRTNTSLRHAVSELEFKVKDLDERSKGHKPQSQLRTELDEAQERITRFRNEVAALEQEKEDFLRRNHDQSRTIKRFVSQIQNLQEEVQEIKQLQHPVIDSPLPESHNPGGDRPTPRIPSDLANQLDDAFDPKEVVPSASITEMAHDSVSTARPTITRLSEYIAAYEDRPTSPDPRWIPGGDSTPKPRLKRTNPLAMAYNAERDFNKYLDDQLREIRNSSMKNINEIRTELMLEDLKNSRES